VLLRQGARIERSGWAPTRDVAVASREKEGSGIVAGGLHIWVVVCLVVDVGAESLEWERRVFGGLVGVALLGC